jgi:hypothetical protein
VELLPQGPHGTTGTWLELKMRPIDPRSSNVGSSLWLMLYSLWVPEASMAPAFAPLICSIQGSLALGHQQDSGFHWGSLCLVGLELRALHLLGRRSTT